MLSLIITLSLKPQARLDSLRGCNVGRVVALPCLGSPFHLGSPIGLGLLDLLGPSGHTHLPGADVT